MRNGSRIVALAFLGIHFSAIALSDVDPQLKVPSIYQGKIKYLQENLQFNEKQPVQYMILELERTVTGREMIGTVLAAFNPKVHREGAPIRNGFRLFPQADRKDAIHYLDPSYWSVGSSVSIQIIPHSGCTLPDSEQLSRWDESTLLCVDVDHVFLVDDHGFVIDGELP